MATYYIDETEYLTGLDLYKTLDRYITGDIVSINLNITDIYLIDNNIFSEFLYSLSLIDISIGEFSSYSSDTTINVVTDIELLIPSIETLLGT